MAGKGRAVAETYLSQAIEAIGPSEAEYDTNAKYLLADKQILARILKYTLQEFREMKISDIISCIGEDIEVGSRPLDPGLSNLGRVNLTNTEDNVPGEGIIFYDIRFTVHIRESEMKILINVEAQHSSDSAKLGYHLENRILFYLARMISAQKQTEFFHSDYDSLCPVRSIWICMDAGDDEDSIEEISLSRNTIYGNKKYPYGTDLMKGIIVNARSGENLAKSQNNLIALLEELLSGADATEKKKILSAEYGMIMTEELERRLQNMCNLSQNILEQGMEKERKNAIERMIRANATKEQILSYGYTEEEYNAVENDLFANA